jgi:hypothetical protein
MPGDVARRRVGKREAGANRKKLKASVFFRQFAGLGACGQEDAQTRESICTLTIEE